ncbi:terminase [Granulicella sp. 5B5]|uniref:phage terminase large subunit family protein n=1 Tax=Granulicella sp. 5B5 TaxID=1617967 RepID=UPI0021042AFE|nr:terminase [Granulicella sp. 5B5]
MIANPAQRRFERWSGRQNIVLKARQMGMTTWVAARFFLRTITRPGTVTLQVAHTRSAAESIFRIVQRMWEELPADLREGPLRRSRANVGQMLFPRIDSEFRIASASDEGVGRGLTIQNLHCSEVSRWAGDAAETLAGLRAALAKDGEMVMESTPNGAYGAFYDEWRTASEPGGKGDGLVRHFLPWWLEPAYCGAAVDASSLTTEECELVARHSLTLGQISFRRGLERSYGQLRSQEFAEDAETCFRVSGSSCFDVQAVERRVLQAPEPRERRSNGALQIWLPPMPGKDYLLAVDSCGGGGEGDYAAVQVLEVQTGLQCAELQQRLRPAELARVAAEVAREYNGSVIVVERNNHGAAVIAYLQTNERYERLWHDGSEAGWLTSSASKPEMIARLGSLLESAPEMFMSRRLLGECRTFVSNERGGSGAASGAHDDLVMAMAIGQAVRARMLESGGRGRSR